jgi:hypothetical protein
LLPLKHPMRWLAVGGVVAFVVDLWLPRTKEVYLADPVSILISIAISAAITAGTMGIEMLMAKKQKVPNVDRGKQDDIRVSTSGYGEFIPKGWGMFRVAPIWVDGTPIVHTVVVTPGQEGGKSPKPPTPENTLHVYTKTVVGIFHDGIIYKGVTKVWFDTDLVYNASNTLSTLNYDAEYGTLGGGASVILQAECSNGRKVTGLGAGGTCQIACHVDSTASHEMAVHYTSTVERIFKISVNGEADVDLVCPPSGAASIVAIQTLSVDLNSGANTILFSNSGAACPDLDMIVLAPALTAPLTDPRSFTGLVDPNRVAPTNQNVAWPVYSAQPIIEDVGDGGVMAGAYQSATLAKYGNSSIRIYPGSRTQPVDSAVLALRGANAPAYRGYGVIVIEGLQLQNGRLPNVTIEVNQGVREVATIVQEIYNLCPPVPTLNLTALEGLVLGDNSGYSAGTYGAITWLNLVNSTQTAGGAITKTSGAANAWNATANQASFASGDAAIRFTVSAGVFMIGFSTAETPTTSTIKFAVLINTTSFPSIETKQAIQMVIDNVQSSDVGTWAAGDVFQVEIRDGRCRAYQNGVELVNFIPPVPSYPLYPVFMGFRAAGGVSAASYAAGVNIGSEPSVVNGGGLILTSRKSAADLLGDLQTRFQFDMIEVDGIVKAILRNSPSDITIPYTDLRAHADGEEMPVSDCVINDLDPYMLPGRVDVNYLDPSLDYHNNTQSDMWLFGGRNDNQSVSLAIVENATNMKTLAMTLLNKADRESRSFTFQTSYKYMRVHPASVVTLTLPNATHVVRILQAKYGLPAGICEFEGVRQEPSVYSPTANGSTSLGHEALIVPIPGNTKSIILDGPLFRAEDAGDGTEPVVYIGTCGIGGGTWPGAFMLQETPADSGVYAQVTSFDKPSGIGVAVGALDDVADYEAWDETSEIDIKLYYDPGVASATEAEIEANPNLNLLAVKNPSTGKVEVVQFKTVVAGVATAPFVARYTLSGFLRGRFNTQDNVDDHTSADEVVIIDSTIKPRRFPASAIGSTMVFRFPTSGQHQDDTQEVEFTLNGYSLQPRQVSDVLCAQDGSSDWLIQVVFNPFPGITPQGTVEVWSAGFAALLGSLPVTIGGTHAVLLNAAIEAGGVPVSEEGDVTIISTHEDKNNLVSIQGGSPSPEPISASGVSLESLGDTWQRFDFTMQWLGENGHDFDAVPITKAVAALEERASTDPVSGKFAPVLANAPLSVEWSAGTRPGLVTETYKSYGVTIGSLETDPGFGEWTLAGGVVGRKGRRYTFLLSGQEYRLYVDYTGAAGQRPLAIVSGADGFNFPLRFIAEVETASDETNFGSMLGIVNIVAGGNLDASTIFSARDQESLYGSIPANIYLKIYENGPHGIQGVPIFVVAPPL